MLTTLNTQRNFSKTKVIASPPSRALANYAKASDSSGINTTDTVKLSEQAQAKPIQTSAMAKGSRYAALGLAFLSVFGAVGCAGGAATAAVETENVQENVQDSVVIKADTAKTEQKTQTHQASKPTAQDLAKDANTNGHPFRELGNELSREGKKLKETFQGKNAEEIGETVGQEVGKVGSQIGQEGKRLVEAFKGKNAEEIGETVGQEIGKVGKQISEEGKKVGEQAVKVGEEVGKVAKGFWKGLTGKGKRNKN